LLEAWAKRQQVAMNPNVPQMHRSSVPKQSTTNKENIQPAVTSTLETTRVKRAFVKGKWMDQALKETMEEVEGEQA